VNKCEGEFVKRKYLLVWLLGGAATFAMTQTTPDAQTGAAAPSMQSSNAKPHADSASTAQPSAVMAIPATLAKTVDSKKVKVGDEVDAKLSVSLSNPSGLQTPAGSKIVGHIADAKSKAKGDAQSSLAFAFEKIVLKNGQEMPLHAVPQAIGMAQNQTLASMPESGGPSGPLSTGAGRVGAHSSPGSGTAAGGNRAASADPSGASTEGAAMQGSGALPQNATGVVGIKGLALDSQPSAAVVSSDSKSVKLEEGTQLLLRVVSQ
jgi:hypothetical protein